MLGCEEEECQYDGDDTGVHIGQTVYEAGDEASTHIAGDLSHGIQQTKPGVFAGNVQNKTGGELINAGLGVLQCGKRREFQDHSHADGENGKYSNAAQIHEETFHIAPPAELIDKEQQENKDTGEESNDWHDHGVTDEVEEIQKLHADDSNRIKYTVA